MTKIIIVFLVANTFSIEDMLKGLNKKRMMHFIYCMQAIYEKKMKNKNSKNNKYKNKKK